MTNIRMLKTGIIGTVIAGICCFTPLLVIVFGALGLSAAVSYLDLILLPALAAFLGVTIYAWKRRGNPHGPAVDPVE